MKQKIITILIILTIASVKNIAAAADYYPEMLMDPLYSSLNPEYINPEETNQGDTLINLLKKKKAENAEKKKLRKLQKQEEKSAQIKQNEPQQPQENVVEENINNKPKEIPTEVELNLLEPAKIQPQVFGTVKDDKEKQAIKGILPGETPDKPITAKQKGQFVTPKYKDNAELANELDKEERKKEEDMLPKGADPIAFLRKYLWPFHKKQEAVASQNQGDILPDVELSADYMEYFPDRYEVEAVGNAKVDFKKQNAILRAHKIVFNYDRNVLRAREDVELITRDSKTEGDFIKLDLNKPEGWLENPLTKTSSIKLSAKEAYIYSDKIEEYEGVAKVLRNDTVRFGSTTFEGYVDQSNIFYNEALEEKMKTAESGVYSIKADTINIDSKDDNEIITLKNADLYLKNHKIAKIPSAKIVSNKAQTSVETNMPEFGVLNMLGAHIGPAVVLDVPGGSTLKLAPVATYDDDKFGVGAIARFRNENNITEMAYGTSRDEFIIRGRQKIVPGLYLNYSRLMNQSEWFNGFRRPKYALELNYRRDDYVKDLKMNFSQMYSAGAYVDYPTAERISLSDADGRFRWMTQSYKPITIYRSDEGNIEYKTALIAQTAATVYTTGDVHGLFRIGPAIQSKIGPWRQTLVYYQTAVAGQSPFEFDRYRYGRSNLVLIESLKVNKFLSVGFLGSLAMNRDVKSDDQLQENRILLSVGPDYAKFTLGYDVIRKNTMFTISMLVGTKNSDIEFNKAVMEDQSKKSKDRKKGKIEKKKNYKKYTKGLKKV